MFLRNSIYILHREPVHQYFQICCPVLQKYLKKASQDYRSIYTECGSYSDNYHRAFSALVMACAFIVASLHIITPAIAAAGPTVKAADTCHKSRTTKLAKLLANHSVIKIVEPAANATSHFMNAATPSAREIADGSKGATEGIISCSTSA